VGARRRMLGFVGGLSVCVVAVLAAAGSALGFVAPVTAGPPKAPGVAQLDFNGFFPASSEIHVGDRVRWEINGFHTVTFLAKGQAQPPFIIISPANPITGQLDAAGKPFWFNGQPSQIINPEAAAPAGKKTYKGGTYLNSGLPGEGPPKPFVVKFTKAGTYTFHCLVHPGMNGVVKVLPKRKHVPSAKKDLAAAALQLKAGILKARALAKVKPAANTVLAGNDVGSVAWLRFFPSHLSIKAGTSVEFKMASKREVHTFTFGPAAYTTNIEKTFATPIKSATPGPPTLGINPLGGYPSDPPPLPLFTGSNHGNGFEGSGVLAMGGPLPSSVKITFTKPGKYSFECVVHEGMDGKITVTP
jgi:plastocyanin